MIVSFEKSKACGEVTAPPSKSYCHRALICAALAEGKSTVKNISLSEDIKATVNCLTSLGAKIELCGENAVVYGIKTEKKLKEATLFCNESGSTLRFLIPVAALLAEKAVFIGSKRLSERPLNVYDSLFDIKKQSEQITVSGELTGGKVLVEGNVSSQFITGLMFALSMCEGGEIVLKSPLSSKPYIDITIDVLKHFGVSVKTDNYNAFSVSGKLKPCNYTVEGDCSNAAFLEAFNMFSGSVGVLGINPGTLQGDFIYKKYFNMLKSGTPVLSVDDCPDLAPVLMSVAAGLNGCVLTGTKRLKIKESDRGEAMKEELLKFGAEVVGAENSITVKNTGLHTPCEILSSHNDHRIAMALSVLCSVLGGKIEGFEAINKSYPEFLNDIKKLGIKAESQKVQ